MSTETQAPGSSGERVVPEKDLLAVKAGREKAEEQLKDAIEVHKGEVAAYESKIAEARQKMLQAEARASSLEEEVQRSAGSVTELAEAKKELAAAKESSKNLTGKILDYRRAAIVATYRIPADSIADKTLEELNLYEEALKSVLPTKGVGNYAVGGGSGATVPGGSPRDLARQAYSK